jgi:hypothetical protein
MRPTKTFAWRNGRLVELERLPPGPRIHLQTDRGFDNLQATDGTDISSRTKWERYQKENGLTVASDWTQTWESAAKQREALFKGEANQTHAAVEKVKHLLHERPEEIVRIGKEVRERPNVIHGTATETIEE